MRNLFIYKLCSSSFPPENFGTLAQSNALTGIVETQSESSDTTLLPWYVFHVPLSVFFNVVTFVRDQPMDAFRQPQIAKSNYHTHLEENLLDHSPKGELVQPGNIRYWSDYSHVYYLPRSIQRMSSFPSCEAFEGNWKQSQDQFWRYNEVNMPHGRFH